MASLSVTESGCLLLFAIWFCYLKLSDLAGILVCNTLLLMYISSACWKFSHWKRQGIPGPSQLPYCGDFPEYICTFGRWQMDFHTHRKKKYGKVYGYYGGDVPILIVADLTFAIQILNSKSCEAKEMTYVPPMGNQIDYTRSSSFYKSGKEWSYFINFTSNWLNSQSIKQLLVPIESFGKRCITAIEAAVGVDGVKVDTIFWTMFFDLFCELHAGTSPEKLGLAGLQLLPDKLSNPLFDYIKTFFPNVSSIVEVTRCLSRNDKKLQDIFQRFHGNVQKLIDMADADSMSEEFRRSFLGQMTEKIRLVENCSQTRKNVPSVADLVGQFEPFDNSRSGVTIMTMLIYELAVHPKIQTRCRDECYDLIKKNKLKSWEDVANQMPYIVACVYEVTRKYPLIGAITRVCLSDNCIVEGIQIPNGAVLQIMHNEIMNSEEYFTNPSEFIPDRFMSKPLHQIKNEGYLVFGLGVRKCIGERLMMTIMAMTAARLISEFKFSLPLGNGKPILEAVRNVFEIKESPAILIEKNDSEDVAKE